MKLTEGNRKFTLAILTLLLATVLEALGGDAGLSPQWVNLAAGINGIFGVANVTEHLVTRPTLRRLAARVFQRARGPQEAAAGSDR